jgi:hypothetical protein
MSISDRGRQFLHSLREGRHRSAWDWQRCPHCGGTDTCKHGTYPRRPWLLSGRQPVTVPRHRCLEWRRTYSEHSPLLVRGSWYAREVHRHAIDL